ncbi:MULTISPECIES: 3-dehydroquinate dehydratase [Sulfurimonas]|uniref:3-dehydroquinate dehydratase n=1 Tax=Sulfurimonas TaxID=202746 RepID=UPI001264CD71|nr:3-dehydroquinate dehydratase [Sulfurimonas indica]
MRFLTRGLYALIFIIFFQTQLLAEYLYKDEIVHRKAFAAQIEKLGSELYQKTGISLRLLMLRELPQGKSMLEYERELLAQFQEPTVLLTFSEMDKEVDIETNDTSLYKYFNRKQVLSPVASPVQAFIMAMVYAKSFETFNEMRKDYGGTILPLLAQKAKKEQVVGKYAGSMYNGYLDIAHQIATAKGVVLENDPGDANQEALFWVKLFFYGFVLYAIVMLIKRKIYKMRHKNEQETE